MITRRPPMRARELDVTGFTEPLEALVHELPEAVSATFIDEEGEAVDLATRVEPFEARVAGALLALPLHVARRFARRVGSGEVRGLWLIGETRSALTARVGEGLDLVLVIEGTVARGRVCEALAEAAASLRFEAGLAGGEAERFAVEAVVMSSGSVRPVAVIERGVRHEVREVLGVLQEDTSLHVLVRTEGQREMLLQYDAETGRWRRR
jgi:predicted regulator of Ras-like GTPase activity (Roadblock/LC7/MglB family)